MFKRIREWFRKRKQAKAEALHKASLQTFAVNYIMKFGYDRSRDLKILEEQVKKKSNQYVVNLKLAMKNNINIISNDTANKDATKIISDVVMSLSEYYKAVLYMYFESEEGFFNYTADLVSDLYNGILEINAIQIGKMKH